MSGLLNKVKSCKCDKNSGGVASCVHCGNGATCTCKINKCKCQGCPNASKKVKKEGAKGDTSSSSSSDEEIGRGERTQPVDRHTGVAQPTGGAGQPVNTTTVV